MEEFVMMVIVLGFAAFAVLAGALRLCLNTADSDAGIKDQISVIFWVGVALMGCSYIISWA